MKSGIDRIRSFLFIIMACVFSLAQGATNSSIVDAIVRQANEDKSSGFTQTQAQLSVPGIPSKVKKQGQLVENEKIIQQALRKERDFVSSHYVFYTAIPYMHLFQDVTRKMYKRVVGNIGALQDKAFQFVRFNYNDSTYSARNFQPQEGETPIQEFLVRELKNNGMIDDNEVRLKTILVSTNLSLFGNAGLTGESTWFFFNNPQPWGEVRRDWLESAMSSYGYSTQFVDEIIALTEYLKDADGNLGSDLFQIFIPKKLVDQIGYLCWRVGMPFDIEILSKVLGGPNGFFLPYPKIKEAMQAFRNKYQAKDPATVATVNELIRRVKDGWYNLDYHLSRYTRIPSELKMINFRQARLLITNDILLNPASGIRIYRYNKLSPEKEKVYKEHLKTIINRMEQERRDKISARR